MISVILYGRNDAHGYNLPKRAAISFNCIAEVLTHPEDEMVFVDCNTPDDLPTFPESIADTLTPRARALLRVLRLRPEQYERGRNGTRFKVLEPLCRNVAIRRSNPRNRWVLNTNTDMVFVPLGGRSLSEVCAGIADGFYELPRFEMPEILWESTDRLDPQGIMAAFGHWGRRLHINEKVVNMPEIRFDGPGDFQLSLRRQIVAIQGMNEAMVLGWHVDSNLCKRMHLLNGSTRSLLEQVYAYHCDHTRINTVYHSAGESTANDYRKFFFEVSRPEIPEQAESWGLAGEAIEEIRLTERTSARYVQVLEQLLPGLETPMLDSALLAESFNHGLLYDNAHLLPYLADHLSTIPPDSDVGYLGANRHLLELLARFRREFGHRGRLLVDPEVFALGTPGGGEAALGIPDGCEAVAAGELHRRAFVVCLDLWMGNFPSGVNGAGYRVPVPSHDAGRYVSVLMRRFQEFARREKARLDSGAALTRKFLFLGSQNTWFEGAASQLFNVVLTPYSSYVRHGFIRKDAFAQPFQAVPGDQLLAGATIKQKLDWLSGRLGRPIAELDFRLAELRIERTVEARLNSAPEGAAGAVKPAGPLERELSDFLQLAYEASGLLEHAAVVQQLRDEWPAQGPGAETVPAAPPPRRGRSPGARVRVAIDAQTFSDPDSMSRGIGHYARHHALALAALEPGWDFVFVGSEPAPPESLQPCLAADNVQYRALADCDCGEFDLFHIPDPLSLSAAAVSPMDLLPGVPATALFHDLIPLRYYIDCWKPPTQRAYLDRLAALRARGVRLLANSEHTRRDVIAAGLAGAGDVTAVLAGLNRAAGPVEVTPVLARQVRKRYGISGPFFLHVGTLDPHKNFQTVIRAMGEVRRRSAQLVVVGRKAHYLKEIADHCAAVGMKDVIFTDFIPREDLEVLYREAVALLFLSTYEGFGFPVLEAMSQGCPVIASGTTSIPEVAGDAAVLLPPLDAAAVGQAMQRLLTDASLRDDLRRKGAAQAARFTWEKTAARTLAVWREMLGSADRAARAAVQGASTSEAGGDEVATHPVPSPAVPAGVGRGIVWLAPWQNASGYCSEALAFAKGMAELPLECVDAATQRSPEFVAGLPEDVRALLAERLRPTADVAGKICIQHMPATGFSAAHGAAWTIGRTMFETDRLPLDWVRRCNLMDEVWVPTEFNRDTFAAAGVLPEKLVVIPEAVDETLFDPDRHEPWPLPHRAACNFLSVFEWSARKGWDTLLAAYLREFSATDDVCLYLRTYLPAGAARSGAAGHGGEALIRRQIEAYAGTLGLGEKPLPRVELLEDQFLTRDVPRFYRAVDCLVMPTRGEGWGRPHHEAMMMGLPVIATRWSGPTEFMTAETGYLLDYELVEVTGVEPEFDHYRGHRWARADEGQLRRVMRRVQQDPEEARARGRAARAHVLAHYSLRPVAERVKARLAEIERALTSPALPAVTARQWAEPAARPANSPAVTVAWDGSFLDHGSLSHVNRELTAALAAQDGMNVVCLGRNNLPPSLARDAGCLAVARRLQPHAPAETAVCVRHAWPPNWTRPAQGAWVLIQPWEFGALPADWVRQLERVDEVWVPSEYVRKVYIGSGVDPAKVQVIPNGVDPDRFRPEAAPFGLPTAKRFKFLFVGGTIHRKGPDLLLQAYVGSFTAADDVCLVVKDFGGRSVYAGQTLAAQIRAAQADPNAPEIVYLDEELAPEQLPGVYTACDCLVHPYRGEGFGLPVLEAMACGLPVIVTGGGATDDFADDELAYRLPARRVNVGSQVGELALVRPGWLLEPSLDALKERMQWVRAHPEEARVRGQAAADEVRARWSWRQAARLAAARLHELAARHPARTGAGAGGAAGARVATIELPAAARVGHLGPAREWFGRKQYLEAWRAALAAVRARPFHPEAWLLLAEIAQATGHGSRARRLAEQARHLAPKWKPARQFLKSPPARNGGVKTALPDDPDLAHDPDREPRLTVCLITRNEEQFIGQCLESVRAVAQQIVVVDTGSTDWTVRIAERFGAEIHQYPWADDFSAARNVALEHARGDWVLMLDADEELTAAGRAAIGAAMMKAGVIAYRLPIEDVGREQEGCNYVPRLFRNAPGLFYVGRVHEQVFSSVEVRRQQWGLENRLGDIRLRHHGYTAEVVASRDKVRRNLRLLELAMTELPDEPNLLMNYGLELVRAGDRERGVAHYLDAFASLSAKPAAEVVPELQESLLTQLATHLVALGRFEQAVEVLRSPLARRGELTASMHLLAGLACMELKRLPDAVQHFRQCLARRNRPVLSSVHKDVRTGAPHHCLALCLAHLNQPEAAAESFEAAFKESPGSRPIRFDYAQFQQRQNRPLEALKLLHQLVGEDPADVQVWHFGGQIALSQPCFIEFAGDWTGEAIKFLPDHPALVAQRAEALFLSGQPAAAAPLWQRLETSGQPRAAAALRMCQILLDQPPTRLAADETAVSREFLNWYRQLLRFNAGTYVRHLNERLAALERVMPTATCALRAVLAEAGREAA